MFNRKESPHGRRDSFSNPSNNNNNQLKANLLSEDYGEAAFSDGYQSNNSQHQHNRSSSSRKEQNQNQISSNHRTINKDQNVELEQKQPSQMDLEKKRGSLLEQFEQYDYQNNHSSINNLNHTQQIVYSRSSQNPNNDQVEENQQNNQNNQDEENNENNMEEEQVQKISIIYLKSLRQFLQGQKLNMGYSIIKIVVGAILLILAIECGFSEYSLWVFLLICQSSLAIVYNMRSIFKMKQPLFAEEIAIDLHQIEMFPVDSQPDDYVDYFMVDDQIQEANDMNEQANDPYYVQREVMPLHEIPFQSFSSQEEDFRKVSMMVLQLKYESKNRDKLAMITGYTQFFFYLGLQIWAIVQFFIRENIFDSFYKSPDDCNINLLRYIFIVVLIGFFQYLDYYIILALIAICSVFILAGLVYYLFKNCKKKRKRTNFIRKLKSIKYNPNQVREDQDCSICLNPFEESEKIIVLPCQAQHHFHDDCIKGWLKVNSTCPMCRTCFEDYE